MPQFIDAPAPQSAGGPVFVDAPAPQSQQPKIVDAPAPRAAAPAKIEPPKVRYKFEQPKLPKNQPAAPSMLRTAGNILEVPFEAVNAGYRDAVNSDPGGGIAPIIGFLKNKPVEYKKLVDLLKAGKFEEASQEYGIGSKAQNEFDAKHGDSAAVARLNDPFANAVETLITEWHNPSNPVVGAALAGLGRGVGLARTAYPALDAGLHATEAAARKVAGPIATGIKSAAGNLFDDFYGVRKAGGKPFEEAIRAKEAAVEAHRPRVAARTQEIFGESPEPATAPKPGGVRGLIGNVKAAAAPVKGLTQAQKIEIVKRSYRDEDGNPIYAPDTSVPEPKGKSLDERAQMYRDDYMAITPELKSRGLFVKKTKQSVHERESVSTDPADILADLQHRKVTVPDFPAGLYSPMRRFGDRKRYVSDDAHDDDSDEIPTTIMQGSANIRRGGFGVRRQGRYSKTYKTLLDVDPANIHPEFDPAHQYYHDMMQKRHDIASVDSQRELNSVVGSDPAKGIEKLPARVAIPYRDAETGVEFGTGEQGYNLKKALVTRQRRRDALGEATNDAVDAGITDAGILNRRLTSASYLRGRLAAGLRSGSLLGRAAGSVDRAGTKIKNNPLLTGGGKAQQAVAEAEGHARNAAADLRAGADQQSALQALLDANVSGHEAARAATAAEIKDLRAAKAVGPQIIRDIAADHLEQAKAIEKPVWDAIKAHGGKITADAIQYAPGKWRYTGQFADIPKRLLKMPDVLDPNKTRVDGNLDQVADAAGMKVQDLKDFLAERPRPTTKQDALAAAREQYDAPDLTPELEAQKKKLDKLRDNLGAVRARAQGAKDAAELYGRTGDNAAAGVDAVAGDMPRIADLIGRGQKANVTAIKRATSSIDRTAAKVKVELDDLAQRYVDARADANAKAWINRRANDIMAELNAQYSIEEAVQNDAVRIPNARRYEHEEPSLSTDSKYHVIEKSLGEYLRTHTGERIPIDADSKGVVHTMGLLNRLARIGIIAVPTVHAVWNLGTHFLATGGSLEQFAKIAAGKGLEGENAAYVDRAAKAGATPGFEQGSFGGDDPHVLTTSPRELLRENPNLKGVGNVIDQYVSKRVWAPNQKLVFDVFERGYAVDYFRRLVESGKTDGEAAVEVRKAFGDHTNVSPREAAWRLTKIFYFYPWMKTLVKFWAKQGLINPKTWDAPARAIEQSNQQQGYDDPSKPFTATMGRRADGEFRRVSLPLPQRITENMADIARSGYDIAAGNSGQAFRDLRSPFDYLAGHLNPVGQFAYDASWNIEGSPKPWQRFADPKASPNDQRLQMAGHALSKIITPAESLSRIASDPVPNILSILGGGFVYGTPTAAAKKLEQKYKAEETRHINNAAKIANPEIRQRAIDAARATYARQIEQIGHRPAPGAAPSSGGPVFVDQPAPPRAPTLVDAPAPR